LLGKNWKPCKFSLIVIWIKMAYIYMYIYIFCMVYIHIYYTVFMEYYTVAKMNGFQARHGGTCL
jgi:hypothetical protein